MEHITNDFNTFSIYKLLDGITFNQACYNYLGNKFVLHSKRSEVFNYIDVFMKNYYETDSSENNFLEIYVLDDVNENPYHNLVIDGEIFQMHIGKGQRWNMKAKAIQINEWRIVHLLNTGSVFMISPVEKKCIVLGNINNYLKEDVFHVIRSLMPRGAEQNGYSIFHAAAVEIGGYGIMIVGEPGQGKTTTFLEFIMQGAVPISNDRVLIPSTGGKLVMHEWPSFINTSIGTIRKIPKLDHLAPKIDFANFDELWHSKIKVAIEPTEFCGIFNVRYKTFTNINMVLFPQLNPSIMGSSLEKIKKSSFKGSLDANCYSPDDPAYLNWHRYMNIDRDSIAQQSDEIINRLLMEVPGYILKGGASLSAAVEQIRNVL